MAHRPGLPVAGVGGVPHPIRVGVTPSIAFQGKGDGSLAGGGPVPDALAFGIAAADDVADNVRGPATFAIADFAIDDDLLFLVYLCDLDDHDVRGPVAHHAKRGRGAADVGAGASGAKEERTGKEDSMEAHGAPSRNRKRGVILFSDFRAVPWRRRPICS